MEVARGVELAKSTDSDAVANALRKNPVYDHYKGKQWWRACDNKSFQDLWIVKGGARSRSRASGASSTSSAKVAGRRGARPDLRREGFRLARVLDISLRRSPPRSSPASSLGGIFVLMAIGLSLIFGLMTVVNFAHGVLLHAGRLRRVHSCSG